MFIQTVGVVALDSILSVREYTRSLNAALDDYADFRRLIDELLDILADMNTLTEDIHVGTDFEALLDRITKPAWASSIGHSTAGSRLTKKTLRHSTETISQNQRISH
jgi:hypothetical protein